MGRRFVVILASATALALSAMSLGASASSASSTTATTPVKEILARVGDSIEISLDGAGFLFLGLPDRQVDGMSFTSRQVADGKTTFVFKTLKLGTYELDFEQQDNASGRDLLETVRVLVVSDAEYKAATEESAVVGPSGSAAASISGAPGGEVGDPAYAERLAAIGKNTAAVAELMKGYRDGNPALNDRIASLYFGNGDLDAAEKYWHKNLEATGTWGDRAVIGMGRLAIARRAVNDWLAWQKRVLAVSSEQVDDLLADAGRLAGDSGEVGLALDLFGEYVRRYPSGARVDEVAFFSAQLLEISSPYRDLRKARELYAALLRDYPESSRAVEALARLRWLDRHVFLVR